MIGTLIAIVITEFLVITAILVISVILVILLITFCDHRCSCDHRLEGLGPTGVIRLDVVIFAVDVFLWTGASEPVPDPEDARTFFALAVVGFMKLSPGLGVALRFFAVDGG